MMENSAPLTKAELWSALREFKVEFKAELKTELKSELKDEFKEIFATKDDLKIFATKEDLSAFATKEDLKAFATKEDLKAFASKEDLEMMVPREELKLLVRTVVRLDGDMHQVRHFLATQVATRQDIDRVMKFADQNLAEMDEQRELRSTRGAQLTDVKGQVEDHERRLRRIEERLD